MRRAPIPVEDITISNPKLYKDLRTKQEARIFPYYAGFSNSFVHDLLTSLELRPESIIFDPWNGSGTTTQSALDLGHRAIGFDLNPAMVVVAKARMLSPLDHPSLPWHRGRRCA
ncbi:DNA methyltransferase [Paraburkholderia ultramafica]|uniref:DNA methyltransferase n=1 Tax=Paraburkholderia ultramafica TaxID=1544867 RepID=UPI0015824C73|nr:DNA methyltransferase [Paraburkholderia ultramafica]